MAVLDSLTTTGTGCGTATGSADIQLVGDESDYTYFWIPNLGTSNPTGNSRTDLPAGSYVVLVYFMGDINCVEKYDFEITDDCFDCPPVFEAAAMVVDVNENATTEVCVPAMYGVSVTRQIQHNDQPYTSGIDGCQTKNVRGYNYSSIPTLTQVGKYSVEWERGATSFYTLVESLDELAASMYHTDPEGRWQNDPKGRNLITDNLTNTTYGQIWITDVAADETHVLQLEEMEAEMGSEILLEPGANEIIYTSSLSGCADTLDVLMNIIPNNNETVLVDDVIQTTINELVTVDLLANDHIDGDVTCMEIVEEPANGQAFIHDGTMMTYLPKKDFCQIEGKADQLQYEICLADGSKYTATAQIEVACRTDHAIYPNPADRHVYLDLSNTGFETDLEVLIVNQLGVEVDRISMEKVPAGPFRIDLESYRSGYYTVWICPKNTKPILKKLVITRS